MSLKYNLRYRIVSDDRNRTSHWSPIYNISGESITSVSGAVSKAGNIVTAVWGDTNNFPEYQQINSKHEVAVMCELTTQNLVQAINLLLNDAQLHARLVANCKAAKMEYNWQIESQKLLAIYRSVAAI